MKLLLFLLLRSINGHFLQNYTTMMSCKVIEMEYENIVVTGLCVLNLVVVLENTVSVFLFCYFEFIFHGACFHVRFCFDFLARMSKRARKNCRVFFFGSYLAKKSQKYQISDQTQVLWKFAKNVELAALMLHIYVLYI